MSAKEMFEELGYEYTKNDIVYSCFKAKCIPDRLNTHHIDFKTIDFHLLSKLLEINEYRKNPECTKVIDKENNAVILSKEELQAINKQCEELGWLDVKNS